MSWDAVHFVSADGTWSNDLPPRQEHETYVVGMGNGLQTVTLFEDRNQAVAMFEEWRRKPCEDIKLYLDGVLQPGGRLPIETVDGLTFSGANAPVAPVVHAASVVKFSRVGCGYVVQ
jgi:hypothetical protein